MYLIDRYQGMISPSEWNEKAKITINPSLPYFAPPFQIWFPLLCSMKSKAHSRLFLALFSPVRIIMQAGRQAGEQAGSGLLSD